MAIRVLGNCRIATMETGYNLIENGVIEISDDVVSWVGSEENYQGDKTNMENLGGRLVTPGLIDCHTHLVFGGDRAREFEMRLKGASYEEISKAGGGIVSTMKATRSSSLDELVESALPRLDALIAEGVTTLEIKSGYGLTIDDEMRMLRAARKLSMLRPVTIVTSWLAAHAVPPEFKGREDDYINEALINKIDEMSNQLKGLKEINSNLVKNESIMNDILSLVYSPKFAQAPLLNNPTLKIRSISEDTEEKIATSKEENEEVQLLNKEEIEAALDRELSNTEIDEIQYDSHQNTLIEEGFDEDTPEGLHNATRSELKDHLLNYRTKIRKEMTKEFPGFKNWHNILMDALIDAMIDNKIDSVKSLKENDTFAH